MTTQNDSEFQALSQYPGTLNDKQKAFWEAYVQSADLWVFDEATETVSTRYSVQSSLNSFKLGEMHTTHSGGENVFDQNNISLINWFPVWQGVKPLPANPVGEHLGFNPTVRQYSSIFELKPNGATAGANSVAYRDEITLQDNESVMLLEVLAGEDYTGRVSYTIRNETQDGLLKYEQLLDVDVVSGDTVQFKFSHPSESRAGDIIAVNIVKDDGSDFLVRASSTVPMSPYLKLYLATYKDVDVVSATQFIQTGFTVRYAGDYECDTTAGSFTITVPDDFRQTFYVSDANQSFGPSNSCNIDFSAFGQGVFSLNASKDGYKFYYDTINQTWRFKDLNTKNGGTV